jgi:tetratricopeptide (TPR) repeat protein
MRNLIAASLVAIAAATSASALQNESEPTNPQQLYEAGQYDKAIRAVAALPDAPPNATYLSALSHVQLQQRDAAKADLAKLSKGDEATPWGLVGRSATASLDGNATQSVDLAKRAVAMAPDDFFPNYQLGLAYSAAEQWEQAADAFEKASTIDPNFAYAHYYAGLAYSKGKRVSRMATHFEYFRKLAPNAPEGPAVETLMRRVR